MNVQSVLLGTLLSFTTQFQPATQEQPRAATLGDQPYLMAIKNPTTDTQVTFICHVIQEN